jgi:D-glycero-alpha-D-manno-heptose-7-phosphate kinase
MPSLQSGSATSEDGRTLGLLITGRCLTSPSMPYVEVQVSVNPRQHDERVRIVLENFNDSYSIDHSRITLDKHPLIEAAIGLMEIPNDVEFDVNIRSDAPPAASTGTSAAVSVALIGALDCLTLGCLTAHEVAALAHIVETDRLGLQEWDLGPAVLRVWRHVLH